MAADFTYSGLALRDIKDGKIATIKIERVGFTANTQQAGKPEKLTGDVANLASHDFDAAAAAAMLDPQKANDDRYYRVYRPDDGRPLHRHAPIKALQMRIDGMTIDDVGDAAVAAAASGAAGR